jgi:hypothetical protein
MTIEQGFVIVIERERHCDGVFFASAATAPQPLQSINPPQQRASARARSLVSALSQQPSVRCSNKRRKLWRFRHVKNGVDPKLSRMTAF